MSQQGRLRDQAIETLTGNSGGPVSPDSSGNVNIVGTSPYQVVGNPATFTLTLSDNGTIAYSYVTDSGTATPSGNSLTIAGGTNINTAGASSTVTINLDSAITLTSIATDNATTGMTLTDATISTDGTDANIDLNLTPKGTGAVTTTKDISMTGAATKINLEGGAATDFIGLATLVTGKVTVANTNITANDRIFLTYEGASITNTGALSYTIVPSTSFDIESTNASDANNVAYFIVRQT